MAIATIQEAIDRGQLSAPIAVVDNEKGTMFSSRLSSPASLRTILMVTDALQWGYDGGAQTDQSLRQTANYLIWLCGMYGQRAQFILDGGGGGGGTVSPSGPIVPIRMGVYLIEVNGGVPDFTNATDYDDAELIGKNLVVFWNDIPRFLVGGTEWAYTLTGIRILIGGFDATANTYDFKIFIKNPFGTSGTGVEVTRPFQYTGTGGETSITAAILSDATIISVSRGTPYELITSGSPVGAQALVNLNVNNLSNGTIDFDPTNPIAAGEVVEIIFSKAV